MFSLKTSDIWDRSKHVSTVDGSTFNAIAVINTAISGFFVNVKLQGTTSTIAVSKQSQSGWKGMKKRTINRKKSRLFNNNDNNNNNNDDNVQGAVINHIIGIPIPNLLYKSYGTPMKNKGCLLVTSLTIKIKSSKNCLSPKIGLVFLTFGVRGAGIWKRCNFYCKRHILVPINVI